jgi:hypothetical protein
MHALLRGSLIKEGVEKISSAYNYLDSKHQIAGKRKKEIEGRRAQLKIEQNDSPILQIVIEEMLS